jgi:outer membrane biosynthesis protein TonB
LVQAPVRARRAPFVVLLLVLLASALIGLLLLNTASAQDSFRLHTLQDEDAVLQQQMNALTGMADGLDNPATLASRAAALGMVAGNAPVFLKRGQPIPKGAIRIGNMVYIPGPPVIPSPAVTTPAATVTTPAVKKPVAKKPVVKKPVTKTPVVARTPATGAKATPTRAPVATAPRTTTTTGTTAGTTAGKTGTATKTGTTATTGATTTRTPATTGTAPVAGGH